MMDGNGLSVADALALQDRNDGFMGGNGMWIFFLFFLLAWGGNGFGFGNGSLNGALTRAEMYDGFTMNNVERQIQGVQQGLCDGFYAMNTGMLNGFNGLQRDLCTGFNAVNASINQSRFDAQQCCCETNRNIDAVRYENAKNTSDIIRAIECDGDKTRAMITANEIQYLRDQLQTANMQLSQQAQSANLINELRPCAKPAYITCSPYEANFYGNRAYNGCCC